MPPKIIFFAGAPTCNSLNWDESKLLTDFTEPFIQFLHLPQSYPNSAPRNNTSVLESSTPSTFGPDWRELPLDRKHLTTGVSQDHAFHEYPSYPGAAGHALDFFSTTTFLSQSQDYSQSQSLNYDTYSFINDENENENENHDQEPLDDETISHFYEHSYAIHDIPSSQIAPHDSFISSNSDDAGTSFSTSNSLYDSQSIFPQSGEENPQIPTAGHVTNLKDIPHAQYLSSIHPQTMTVNLIVGIISISEPRTITTRKGGEVSLIEILVGDDTKSGFMINFWLSGKEKGDVREILANLRVQDIVLMKNVALGSFRGKVHGQSLRRDLTRVGLLFRVKVDRCDVGGCYRMRDLEGEEIEGHLGKVRRVREWVVRFVGVAAAYRGLRGVKRRREELPPDTQ